MHQKNSYEHAQKMFIPLYLKHLLLLINRARWQVTKIYSHYTLEPETFNHDFALMNQHPRQNAKNSVDKDHFKLLKGANCGYDCRNSLNNCTFKSVCAKLTESRTFKSTATYSTNMYQSV